MKMLDSFDMYQYGICQPNMTDTKFGNFSQIAWNDKEMSNKKLRKSSFYSSLKIR